MDPFDRWWGPLPERASCHMGQITRPPHPENRRQPVMWFWVGTFVVALLLGATPTVGQTGTVEAGLSGPHI